MTEHPDWNDPATKPRVLAMYKRRIAEIRGTPLDANSDPIAKLICRFLAINQAEAVLTGADEEGLFDDMAEEVTEGFFDMSEDERNTIWRSMHIDDE